MSSPSPLSRRYFVTGRSIVTPEEIGRQKTSQIWSKTVIQPVNNIVKQIKIISKYFGYALPRQVGNQYSVLSVYVGWEIGISPQNIHQSHWAPAIHLLRLPGMRISGVVCEMWHQQWQTPGIRWWSPRGLTWWWGLSHVSHVTLCHVVTTWHHCTVSPPVTLRSGCQWPHYHMWHDDH